MTKDIVKTTRKQAQLPEGAGYERPKLANMALGDVAYTTGWAMEVDGDRACWLRPNYSAEPRPGGTVSMRVERRVDGFHVWPARGYAYDIGDVPQRDALPVAELHYDHLNLPRHV